MKPPSLDSSAWIEIFHGGPNAPKFLKAIANPPVVVVSPISIYEVWKYTMLHADEARARLVTDFMRQGVQVPLDGEIAIQAANLSLKMKIPMADCLIYTASAAAGAILWTQDDHFKGLPRVNYFPKQKS